MLYIYNLINKYYCFKISYKLFFVIFVLIVHNTFSDYSYHREEMNDYYEAEDEYEYKHGDKKQKFNLMLVGKYCIASFGISFSLYLLYFMLFDRECHLVEENNNTRDFKKMLKYSLGAGLTSIILPVVVTLILFLYIYQISECFSKKK